MIFPDISLKEFKKKYPEVSELETRCEYCGNIIKAIKPFLEKNFAGLISEPCTCGKYKGIVRSVVCINNKEQ